MSYQEIFLDEKVSNLVKEIIGILELLFVVRSAAHIGLFEEGGSVERRVYVAINATDSHHLGAYTSQFGIGPFHLAADSCCVFA